MFGRILWEGLFEKSPSHTLLKNFYHIYMKDMKGAPCSLSFA